MYASRGRRGVRKPDLPATPGQKRSPYIVDKSLTPRIKQYLSQFRKGYTPDIDELTSHLQTRYGEYNRKKRNSFRLSVLKVYQNICHEQSEETMLQNLEDKFLTKRRKSPGFMPMEEDILSTDAVGHGVNFSREQSSASDSELSLNDEPLMEAKDTNLMNQSMQKMYKVSSSQHASEAEDESKPIFVIPLGDKIKDLSQTPLSSHNEPAIGSSNPALPPSTAEVTHQRILDQQDNVNERRNTETLEKKPSKSVKKKRRREGSSKEGTEKPLESFASTQSSVKFADIGGCSNTLEQVGKLLVHMCHPEVFTTLGVTPTTGFLLHGPPGCGKTLLAHAIAGELEMPFLKLAATEIVSGVSGESEEKVRELFTSAVAQAPCILFLDEIDAITPKRENASKDMERRIVSQLLSCMDDLNNNPDAHVLVIGATNRPDSLDPALRRAGRFDREISMGIPDESARASILRVMCKQLKLSADFSFLSLSRQTPGYVGADLMALTREAAMIAVNRTFESLKKDTQTVLSGDDMFQDSVSKPMATPQDSWNVMEWLRQQPPLTSEQLSSLCITMDDFVGALAVTQPSAKREGFATVPDVTWANVGALKDVREELTMAILAPVQHPEEFSALGLTHPPGILLAGPPGCGKTLLAKAIANESGINFISVKGPELLNMYVGESERAVRQVFQRARNSAPCVIFFDELDSLCPRRSGSSESGSSVRVVNQLLTEMDGLQARKHVFIMGATNRPDIIDPAVMRPGRLDKVLYVGLPSAHDRQDILRTLTKEGRKPFLLPDVHLGLLAEDTRCNGFSGADLAALVREASMAALRERINLTSLAKTAGPSTTVPTLTSTNSALKTETEPTVTKDVSSASVSVTMASKTHDVANLVVGVGARHFDRAFDKVRPSVSPKDQEMYEKIRDLAAKL